MSVGWGEMKPRAHSGILSLQIVIDAAWIGGIFGIIILLACLLGGDQR